MKTDQNINGEIQLLWIANLFLEKISADDYRGYNLGLIFFKYLSAKQYIYANELSTHISHEFTKEY